MPFASDRAIQKIGLVDALREGAPYGRPLTIRTRFRRRIPRRLNIGVILALAGFTLFLTLVSYFDVVGPERNAFMLMMLYAPRWALLIPAGLLMALTPAGAPKWAPLALADLVWVIGPVMGLSLGIAHPAHVAGSLTSLRVVTYNVTGGAKKDGVIEEILECSADVICLQEADALPEGLLPTLHGWHIAGPVDGCVILSRYAISSAEPRSAVVASKVPYRAQGRYAISSAEPRSASGQARRQRWLLCTIDMNGTPVHVADVTLDRPRPLLETWRAHPESAVEELRRDADARIRRAAQIADELATVPGPLVVAGDLNAPSQSMVCRAFNRDGLRDSFAAAGLGYGYTCGRHMRYGIPFVRADHILVGRGISPLGCHTGEGYPSEHHPVIADLHIEAARPR